MIRIDTPPLEFNPQKECFGREISGIGQLKIPTILSGENLSESETASNSEQSSLASSAS